MPPKVITLEFAPQRAARPWILVPCLVTLRAEFDKLNPGRDRASDGTIGDQAHAARPSDHNPDETGNTPFEDADDLNEVHALDVDDDIDPTRPDLMEQCVQLLVARHAVGKDVRLQNIIYRRRIWGVTTGWRPRPYTGASPHTEHAHFSARYTTAQEADTSPYGLQTLGDEMERAEFLAHLKAGLADTGVRKLLAEAVLLTDNVVTLDWPDGERDAGAQSLIRWPGGHAAAARDQAAAAYERANEAVTIGERVEAKLDALIAATTPDAAAGAPAAAKPSTSKK